jgi:hypothetical protein
VVLVALEAAPDIENNADDYRCDYDKANILLEVLTRVIVDPKRGARHMILQSWPSYQDRERI